MKTAQSLRVLSVFAVKITLLKKKSSASWQLPLRKPNEWIQRTGRDSSQSSYLSCCTSQEGDVQLQCFTVKLTWSLLVLAVLTSTTMSLILIDNQSRAATNHGFHSVFITFWISWLVVWLAVSQQLREELQFNLKLFFFHLTNGSDSDSLNSCQMHQLI